MIQKISFIFSKLHLKFSMLCDFLVNLVHSECLVNTKLIKCQANLEMSCFQG